VPASDLAGAGMSRHLRPRNGAGESFVCFIRLFGRIAHLLERHILRRCAKRTRTASAAALLIKRRAPARRIARLKDGRALRLAQRRYGGCPRLPAEHGPRKAYRVVPGCSRPRN
jgi:hypothetical protein